MTTAIYYCSVLFLLARSAIITAIWGCYDASTDDPRWRRIARWIFVSHDIRVFEAVMTLVIIMIELVDVEQKMNILIDIWTTYSLTFLAWGVFDIVCLYGCLLCKNRDRRLEMEALKIMLQEASGDAVPIQDDWDDEE